MYVCVYIYIYRERERERERVENGNRLVSFVHMYNLIIVSTKFQHTKIYKGTWIIPGTNDVNQTDHVLVNRRRMHTITDVRSM